MRWRVWALALTSAWPASAQAERPIVAVFDIEARGVRLSPQVLEDLSDFLATQLSGSGAVDVVPRDDLRRRLAEQKATSHKQCFDQTCQIEIGKAISAAKSVGTKIAKIGRRCVVSATAYDLRREASDAAASAEFPADNPRQADAESRLASVEAAAAEEAERRARLEAARDMVEVPAGPFLGCNAAVTASATTRGRAGKWRWRRSGSTALQLAVNLFVWQLAPLSEQLSPPPPPPPPPPLEVGIWPVNLTRPCTLAPPTGLPSAGVPVF